MSQTTESSVLLDIEDEVQDWRALSSLSKSDQVIPKRGEKDFEPDGTDFQSNILEESRTAMYDALRGARGHSSKQHVQAVFHQSLGLACVEQPKGPFFKSMGKSDKLNVWLTPEEVIYLAERGSISVLTELGLEMSLEHLYSCIYNEDNANVIEQYQVYAHLKRHGYIVMRHEEKAEGTPRKHAKQVEQSALAVISNVWKSLCLILFHGKPNWGAVGIGMVKALTNPATALFTPITQTSYFQRASKAVVHYLRQLKLIPYPLLHPQHYLSSRYTSFKQILISLRIVPHYDLFESHEVREKSPYQITYNVWKPVPSFKKSDPPTPDFQVCVVNTDTTKFPSLAEIQTLFNTSDYVPQSTDTSHRGIPNNKVDKNGTLKKPTTPAQKATLARIARLRKMDKRLKFGYRNVILAITNCGVINYVRLSEVDFSREEVYEESVLRRGK
ncbi:hypothetical protein BABINDRAFT_161518 [Babjeviella inositovora NRRL Y-12698]|uniref:tRNA-splicing endonuclease subunit Sen54 N-terminal domain-containing protein n=1 Tax=Babjeviella inositovora NRRL Y-12698 TaxID=984486 RepID=A0A1E3QQ84_9ASCO|nr:uncharacterized protein BABINDRAFT_161518 [Babjeviella inositovora NRRL Y-12698]ODQ79831.1 hypothetical protein BABINDRAFT_161518 [Babjeviella inositovora NRRL Y-12698]